MTTFLSEPIAWKIAASVLGAVLALWRLRRFVATAENRRDIVVDGWVTRFSDDPAVYRQEEKRLTREQRKDIAAVIAIGLLEVLVWSYL